MRQLYDPTLGAAGFVNAVLEQATGASPEVRSCLQWMSAFQPLRAFLNAVKEDPAAFAIPLVSRASILDSLRDDFAGQPSVTWSSLAPLSWAINATVWWMHCDNIRATRRESIIASFDLYLSRAAASMKRAGDGDNPFGSSPLTLNPAMAVLHLPRNKNWSECKLRLQAYADPSCALPLAADFWMIKVMTTSAWPFPLLETHEELEEQLAMQNPSPDSAQLQRRLQNPRSTSTLDNSDVHHALFPPAGDSWSVPFQQLQTGTPPGQSTMTLAPRVMTSQQRSQQTVQQQLQQQQSTSTSSNTAGTYNTRLRNLLDGEDASLDLEQHGLGQHGKHLFLSLSTEATDITQHQEQHEYMDTTTVGQAETLPLLGLGMSMETMAQDPHVAARASAHQQCCGSHLATAASVASGSCSGMAAFQDNDLDDSVGSSTKQF